MRYPTYLVAYRKGLQVRTAEDSMTFRSKVVDELQGFRVAWRDCRPLSIAGLTLASALRVGLHDTFALGLAFLVFAALAWGSEVPDGKA
ncbi:hypothetical protein WJ05_06825 [Burkholderia vietnamiensis]|nr:hypothetical protein WJ05_06825 [Burkholderia vietnamiensis]